MKTIFSIILSLFLSVSTVNAQVLVNPEKLPTDALNFMVANDMGETGSFGTKEHCNANGEKRQNLIGLILLQLQEILYMTMVLKVRKIANGKTSLKIFTQPLH